MGLLPRNMTIMSGRAQFIKAAIVYNVVIFAIFFLVYNAIDFKRHWATTQPVTTQGILYFTVMAHTSSGSNDMVPKTDTARILQALHVTLAWAQLLLVFAD